MVKHSEKFFDDKIKENTRIKLNIFENLLHSCFSIADNFSFKTHYYCYLDLFAGSGSYENYDGSPIIAYNIFEKELFNKKNLKNLKMLLLEKDYDNYSELTKKFMNKEIKGLSIKAVNDEWENQITIVENSLIPNSHGFCFADPFFEIDLNSLIQLFANNDYYFHDILIWYNYSYLLRYLNNDSVNLSSKKVIDLEKDSDVLHSDLERFSNHFQKVISYKDFVIVAFLPCQAKGKLKKGNFYALILATNSTGVCNAFLKQYEEEKRRLYGDYLKNPLTNQLEKDILFILESKNEIDLADIFRELMKNHISWKKIIKKIDRVPTIENIIDQLNNFQTRHLIEFDISNDIISDVLTKKKKLKKNLIKKSQLKKIVIRKTQNSGF